MMMIRALPSSQVWESGPVLHKGTECKSYRGTDGSYYKAVELEWHCAHKSEIPENEE